MHPSSSSYAALTPPTLYHLRNFFAIILWDWIIGLARNRVLSVLQKGITKGRLDLFDAAIGQKSFGQLDGRHKKESVVSLTVKSEMFWLRIFFSYDIGFSEAYMTGEFETSDLKALLNLYIDNLDCLQGLASPVYRLLRFMDVIVTFCLSHGINKSLENVAGYNASNEMYQAFLSTDMMYSCPIWAEDEGGVRGDLEGCRFPGDLEAAQARKIVYILKKARLSPGDRLLEIGSGWGGLAIAAAKMGCTVDTITISVEQQRGAEQNIRRAGVQDKVTVHFLDYRHLPAHFEKAFDACISTEMLEAVGVRNMKIYLSKIDWALKDKKASVVLSSTTYPESTYTPYQGNDFTRKYHWPNGVSPSPTSLLDNFQKHIPRRFCLDTVEDLGNHYPRCLREWARRFEENWTEKLALTLTDKHPKLKDPAQMEMFRRKWHYMFMYMDVAYSRRWLGVTYWTMKRPGQDPAICS